MGHLPPGQRAFDLGHVDERCDELVLAPVHRNVPGDGACRDDFRRGWAKPSASPDETIVAPALTCSRNLKEMSPLPWWQAFTASQLNAPMRSPYLSIIHSMLFLLRSPVSSIRASP